MRCASFILAFVTSTPLCPFVVLLLLVSPPIISQQELLPDDSVINTSPIRVEEVSDQPHKIVSTC